jgi:hypothetical protein
MSPEHRAALLANQRAAAFTRFQLLGDHEAMHLVLLDLEEHERLSFVTALASISGALATRAMGQQGALDYLRQVAETSASLANSGLDL